MPTAIQSALKALFAIGPILFGIAFMAPVLAELMVSADITQPFGLAPITLGLAIGGAWGTYAVLKGSWL